MANSQSYVSSACEIKTINNELFATGYISEVNEDQVTIRDRYGQLPISEYGRIVKVCVYNYQLGFRVLVGKVYTSTNDFIQVVEVIPLIEYERRNFFRVSVNIPGTVRRRASDAEEEEQELFPGIIPPTVDVTPHQVVIRDISLGGVLVETREDFGEGEKLRVSFKMRQTDAHFKCVSRRKITPEGESILRIGCEFEALNNALSSELCAFIFQKQREQIDKRKQT